MENGVSLSVVIIAKNEEERIGGCLESVKWADEIIVVDDMSTDMTVEIARQYTDKIVQRKMDVEGAHRNYAYSLAKNEWILSLDADERVSRELKDEISNILKQEVEFNVFAIGLRNYIGNYWVRWGGWYPAYKDRLFRRGRFRYEEVHVHPRVIYDGRCGKLNGDIIHYSYDDLEGLTASLNGQTTKEAQKWVSTGRKVSFGKAMWRALDRFIRAYISKKGYRDGVFGLVVALNGGLYQILSYAKYREAKNNSSQSVFLFIEKENALTTRDAKDILNGKDVLPEKIILYKMRMEPFKEFFRFYLGKWGLLKGIGGFLAAVLNSFSPFLKWAKYWELAYGKKTP